MQRSGILVSLGGLAVLVGFLFLPFGLHPLYLRMQNGIQLMQFFPHQLQIAFPQDRVPWSISYGAMWVIILTGALLAVLALVPGWSRKAGIGLPLTYLLLSLAALSSQFLAFYLWGTNGTNLWYLMFTNDGVFAPITGIGWWVSAGGALLALVGSILRWSNSRGGKAALTSS